MCAKFLAFIYVWSLLQAEPKLSGRNLLSLTGEHKGRHLMGSYAGK